MQAGVDVKDWERDHMTDAVTVLQSHHMDAISAAASAATECVPGHWSLLHRTSCALCTSRPTADRIASSCVVLAGRCFQYLCRAVDHQRVEGGNRPNLKLKRRKQSRQAALVRVAAIAQRGRQSGARNARVGDASHHQLLFK